MKYYDRLAMAYKNNLFYFINPLHLRTDALR